MGPGKKTPPPPKPPTGVFSPSLRRAAEETPPRAARRLPRPQPVPASLRRASAPLLGFEPPRDSPTSRGPSGKRRQGGIWDRVRREGGERRNGAGVGEGGAVRDSGRRTARWDRGKTCAARRSRGSGKPGAGRGGRPQVRGRGCVAPRSLVGSPRVQGAPGRAAALVREAARLAVGRAGAPGMSQGLRPPAASCTGASRRLREPGAATGSEPDGGLEGARCGAVGALRGA